MTVFLVDAFVFTEFGTGTWVFGQAFLLILGKFSFF